MENIGNNGHRQRLRQKYLQGGYKSLLDYELLELLLTYSIARRDVKPIAKTLLARFGNLEKVFKASKYELLKTTGIGEISSVLLNIIGDISTKIYEDKIEKKDITTIENQQDLLMFLKNKLAFDSTEQFMGIFLDSLNQIILSKVLFYGTLDKSVIYPREIIKYMILTEAKSVIFVHNHPSGSVYPSKQDIELTQDMYKNFKILGFNLIDHIIITLNGYFSFLNSGLLMEDR